MYTGGVTPRSSAVRAAFLYSEGREFDSHRGYQTKETMSYQTEDKTLEVVRGKGKKKREEFAWCKWAAQAWEAEFYAHTDAHKKSRARTLKVLMTDNCWYSTLHRLKNDTRKMQNRISGGRKPRHFKQDSNDEA